jgi:hypothetical protein
VKIAPAQNIMLTKHNITERLLTLTKGLNSAVLSIIVVIIILLDKPGAMQ